MPNEIDSSKQRLQKLLANAGLASRRVVEQMIIQERISVNGQIATLGMRADENDQIYVDGEIVNLKNTTVTYLLNKPQGVLSSVTDDRGRKTVVDLIDCQERIYPVGRLDADTTGLILVSNDGDLTYRLTHPGFGVVKTYVARLLGSLRDSALAQLRNGVELEDGITAPARVKVLARKKGETLIEIAIHEGRNRQIRRMSEAIGHRVLSLQRIQIGPLSDSSLAPGEYRRLTLNEIHDLYRASSGENVSKRAH